VLCVWQNSLSTAAERFLAFAQEEGK